MDCILQIGNYSESSEINICLCLNYLDVFIVNFARTIFQSRGDYTIFADFHRKILYS